MGCVFQSTEEKHVTKVDWMFSSEEGAKEEYVLYYYANLSVPVGRFQNRTRLAGDVLHWDGSLLLQNVKEADQGTYTCEMRLEMESVVLKQTVVLHVLPEEPSELTIHVGDSTQMGCVFQSTAKKRVTMVEWMFSPEESAKVMERNQHCSRRFWPMVSGELGERGIRRALGEWGIWASGSPRGAVVYLNVTHQMEVIPGLVVRFTTSCACEESVLHYNPKFNAPVGYSQNRGRFQNRVMLVGDISRNDGSIMLQGVKESDRGSYTCSIYLGKLKFRKTIVLHVILTESQRLVTSEAPKLQILGGDQLVIIVGIVCATVLLLPVLIVIAKRIHRNA
ncbi:Junctional adhesion molecule-like, partial [Galemys pyrenaicus]